MATTVAQTAQAKRIAARLRGHRGAAYERWLDDLERRGCVALDYRLAGPTPLSYFCVRHLRGADRALVLFESPVLAVVAVVGRHTGDPATDVYEELYETVGVRPPPEDLRDKPPCCEPDGAAPVAGAAVIDALVREARRLAR